MVDFERTQPRRLYNDNLSAAAAATEHEEDDEEDDQEEDEEDDKKENWQQLFANHLWSFDIPAKRRSSTGTGPHFENTTQFMHIH